MQTTPATPMKRVLRQKALQPPMFAKLPQLEPAKMTQASSLPLGVPAFKPIPSVQENDAYNRMLQQSLSIRQKAAAATPNRIQNKTLQQIQYLMNQQSMSYPGMNYPESTKMQIVTAVPAGPNYVVSEEVPNTISRISTGTTFEIPSSNKNEVQSMISPFAHVRPNQYD